MKGRKPAVRKLLRIALILIALLLISGLAALWLVRRATRQVPDFYAAALEEVETPVLQAEMSDAVEREALDLHNDARSRGDWEAVFADRELNAWAATVLPEKFPNSLPSGVGDPRVKFAPDTVYVACRFKDDALHLDTVLSIEAQVFLTDKPNEIAFRVNHIRAGTMPLMRGPIVDRLVREARNAGVHLRMTQLDDDPLLQWRMPLQPDPNSKTNILIRNLVVRDGEIYLAGETVADSPGS